MARVDRDWTSLAGAEMRAKFSTVLLLFMRRVGSCFVGLGSAGNKRAPEGVYSTNPANEAIAQSFRDGFKAMGPNNAYPNCMRLENNGLYRVRLRGIWGCVFPCFAQLNDFPTDGQ